MTEPTAIHEVPVTDLIPYPGNARRGDLESIKDSLTVNGQYAPLVVQQSTGYVIVGNHRLAAARELGWPTVEVRYLDVDDAAARRIVIADNRTSDLGSYDDRALLDLLREMGDDLSGTGFALDDFDDLLASLEEADADSPPQPPTALIPGEGGAPAGQGGAYGPDGDGSNVRTTPSYAEYEAQYSSRATRFMALNYPLAQYGWIVDRLSKIAEDEGVDNFAEAVLRLVEKHTGETAPPLEDGQQIGGPPSAIALLPGEEEESPQ